MPTCEASLVAIFLIVTEGKQLRVPHRLRTDKHHQCHGNPARQISNDNNVAVYSQKRKVSTRPTAAIKK
jgi:hypothetical protein